MEDKRGPQEQKERLYRTLEIHEGSAVFQVELYLPTKGTGSLKGRLLRLMEQELREQGKE